MISLGDRVLAVFFGLAYGGVAIASVVWLPGAWGLLVAPPLLWLAWLLIYEAVIAEAPAQEPLPPLSESTSPSSQRGTDSGPRLAA